LTGYSAVAQAIETALADPEVAGLLLEIDSGGGEAGGALDLARLVRQAAARKLVWAMVNEVAASSAYGIASGAETIVASPTAAVGSIGALAVLSDHSGELARRGRKVTIIRSLPRKATPSGVEPITDADLAEVRARIDAIHSAFVGLVAEHREITPELLNSLEGRVLGAQEALEAGLIDGILPAHEVRAEFAAYLGTGSTPAATTPEDTSMPANFARSGAIAGAADALLNARQQLAARHNAILSLPEAQGSFASLASFLAINSDLEVEGVKQALALAAQIGKAQGVGSLSSRMPPNPNVGSDDGYYSGQGGADGEIDEGEFDAMLADLRRLRGDNGARGGRR
jgi:ClpP class serine protease